jgi:hypothetical protein
MTVEQVVFWVLVGTVLGGLVGHMRGVMGAGLVAGAFLGPLLGPLAIMVFTLGRKPVSDPAPATRLEPPPL